jgi:hypothetical protein
MPTISPNTSNQNFEIAISFNLVESSENWIFEDDSPFTALRARVVIYDLGAYKVFIESVVVETQKGLNLLEIERAFALFNSLT